jgi:hypothetical protein
MRSHEQQRAAALAILLLVLCGGSGCNAMINLVTPAGESTPHVKGRWTGVIEPITLHGIVREGGESHQAAVLRIIDGPALPHPVPAEIGGGQLPIITEFKVSNIRIVPPERLPLGRTVEVRGMMVVEFAICPHKSSKNWHDLGLHRQPGERASNWEHLIVLKGDVRVLDASDDKASE